jgi:2'-5' RNA ligase
MTSAEPSLAARCARRHEDDGPESRRALDSRTGERHFGRAYGLRRLCMPRLFAGLEIPSEIRLQLSGLRGGLPGARWVDPDNYHMTLRFIGDIDEPTAQDVLSILGDRRQRDPITVTFDALDSFGGTRPHAVFARAVPTSDLNDLQAEIERLIRKAGLPPEKRKFFPHVTLARLKSGSAREVAGYIATSGHFPKLSFMADRFVLFSSRGTTGGGPYVVEAAYPLA